VKSKPAELVYDLNLRQPDIEAINAPQNRPSHKNMKALVITVKYESAASTLAFFTSLQRNRAFSEIGVIIVDNSRAEEHLPGVCQAIAQFANVD
jgi:hypothetical protein